VDTVAEPYVRPMRLLDLEQVLAIERVSFPTPWSEAAFVHELTRNNNRSTYLVAASGSKVLGYGGMWQFAGEGHITNLAVHPDHRRRGLGIFILEALIDRARESECETVTLEVRESNHAARELYEKAGLGPVGRRHGYYTDTREDAIIMTMYGLERTPHREKSR